MNSFVVLLVVVITAASVDAQGSFVQGNVGGCDGVDCGEGKFCDTFGERMGFLFHACMDYAKEGEMCNSRRFKCPPPLTCVPLRLNSMFGFGQCRAA